MGIVFLGWGILYVTLVSFTKSDVPGWDAWVSSTAWAGMWLLAKRKVENWLLLNISNAFAIPLLFMKDLPLFAVLTIILFLVACKGYFDWMKKARNNMPSVLPA
jgi:nicotinamide mononucleotide transporter